MTAVANALSGSIFTTNAGCGGVNINIFSSKDAVYLNGGPQGGGPGLPEGDYYVKATDPSGGTLLGIGGSATTPVQVVHVNASGSFDQCYQLSAILNSASSGFTAAGYDTTPNNGNEYKVSVSSEPDFPNNDQKTDNFKVIIDGTPPTEAAAPTVTKTATAMFDRDFTWSIEKSVSCVGGSGGDATYDDVVQKTGGNAKCDYTIDATKSAPSDTNWVVSGTITVSNSNTGGPIELDDVTDATDDPSSTCIVHKSGGLTVPASGDATFPYECTYSDAPDPTKVTNTGTASWSSQPVDTDELVSGTADGTATFAFDSATETNECATITDTLDGTPTTLGTVCETTQFTPSVNFNVPSSGCADHNNEAKSDPSDDGPDDTDGASVRICGPVGGEGTMGFWQNKNGQALIKAGSSTATGCGTTAISLKNYLATFAPFGDIGSQAVDAYVTSVIKAATAKGPTMNAMLKAQMLSTALDVYFGRVPGGTLPGDAEVDLTKWSGGFGGAPSMTVCQMLDYAAGRSSNGGGIWYGQIKATQELAKNAFDAINNGVALSI